MKNILFEIITFANYTVFSSLRQIANVFPKKLFGFGGKPIIVPFFHIFVRN